MSAAAVRQWLGLYVLILASVVGAYLLMATKKILPLEMPDRVSATEIIVPFLLGQVAAVFRFYTTDHQLDNVRRVTVPKFVVVAPPIIVTVLLLIEFILMAIGGILQSEALIPPAESFKGLLTFCVALLNATTVFVIARYFQDEKPQISPRKPTRTDDNSPI